MLSESDQQQLHQVKTLVQAVLGEDAVGAYLFGSAMLGGLRPYSDLDVIVVTKRPTTHSDKQRFVQRLLENSGRQTADGRWRYVELTIVVEGDIKPWRYPPKFDFQYGDWLRAEFEDGNVEPWPTTVSPDLATLLTQVRMSGRSMFGPPPAEYFEPVPADHLLRAMIDSLDPLLADLAGDTRNVLLTLARMWFTLATGAIASKDAAAQWASERMPKPLRPVLQRARAIYLGEHAEQWDDLQGEVEPCVEFIVAEIRNQASALK